MNWYARYPGDYQRDTGHLSLEQHGAYAVLLDAYYGTGRPLPASAVHRLTRAVTDSERSAVDSVLSEFWIKAQACWTNPRAKAEIDKAMAKREAAQAAAKRRWDANAHANAHADDHANASATRARGPVPPPEAIEPDPEPTPKGTKIKPLARPRAARRLTGDADFDSFWAEYPRKAGGKKRAHAAWVKASGRPHITAIIAAVRAHVDSDQWQREGGSSSRIRQRG